MSAPANKPAPLPYTILITALGGEGGGVLMNWIVAAAKNAGLPVQATSVPGVAQRTGSTSYYIEMQREASDQVPVFALVPMPGRVDVVIASELVEAGRMMERGFVSPDRTTLITSTSRVYATAEKLAMGEGRFAPERVLAGTDAMGKRVVTLDLEALARENGTMVSATMFGALAGAGVLPWPREVSLGVIGEGASAKASRAGFEAAYAAVLQNEALREPIRPANANPVEAEVPVVHTASGLAAILALGQARCTEYQDEAYGTLYRERIAHLVASASGRQDQPEIQHALEEAARRLALWMAYEDIARVAELKTRPERFARIRREVQAKPGQIVRVIDYLKPGADEIAAMLPAPLGRRMKKRIERGGGFPFLGKGIHLSSTGFLGFLLLRMMANAKAFRRSSLRWQEEQAAIEQWLAAMAHALTHAPHFAGALAELPRLLKGYSDTQLRGITNYRAIFARYVLPHPLPPEDQSRAAGLRKAIAAALADPEGVALAPLIGPASVPAG